MDRPKPFLVAGKWESSDDVLEVLNPYDQSLVGTVCRPGAADVDAAIEASEKAFERTRRLPAYQRGELLIRAAAIIGKRHEELAQILCRESGKPIRHARGEVTRAISTLTVSAEESRRMNGECIPLDITPAAGNRLGIVRHYPIGPIGGISPFNFPLNLVCHKVAPAMATGNSISIKPASATPLSALLLGEILLEAGVVPGAFNVIPASARLAESLVTDPRLKMVTFTGSAEVGWGLKSKAGKKRVCLELGGNAAVIVEPDADMDYAVKRCVLGGYAYAGQICISVQRIFVHELAYDQFAAEFIKQTRALKLGDPALEETDVGPMIDEASAIQTMEWIEEAASDGARVLSGGECDGTMVQPTIIENAKRDAKVSCKEVFAPVVVLDSYKTFEEALAKTNDSDFGLQAGVFSADIEKAFLAYNTIEAGGIIINDIPTFRVDHMPYGGVKDSGFGREGVKYTMEEMTEIKLMVINHGLSV